MVAATHCFDLDLMDTVVKRNMNPIEKVERSMLIMANTIHQASVEEMTTPESYARINSATPQLVEQLPALRAPTALETEADSVAASPGHGQA